MKYTFEEVNEKNAQYLKIQLEDVPTLEGNLVALEAFFDVDIGSSCWLINEIDKLLKGEEKILESTSNMFDFIITKDKATLECIFEEYGWEFTISTEVLYEIAITWHRRITEFNEKYKKKHFWRRK